MAHGCSPPTPRPGPGCLLCGLSPQSISGGPGGMIALGPAVGASSPFVRVEAPTGALLSLAGATV